MPEVFIFLRAFIGTVHSFLSSIPEFQFFFSAAIFTARTFQPLPFHCFCLTLVSGKTRFGRKEKDFCLLTSLSRRSLLVKCLEWEKLKYVTQVAFGLDCNPWGCPDPTMT